jgi:membrane protein implicated in regulation of membrane protease activity
MTHEHSLHGLIRGLLLLALLWATWWAGYTWLALATLLTWLPKRAVRHDLAVPGACAARLAS